MITNNTTPLWLNLKKEYIDDNFEEFLEYMRAHGGSKGTDDVFFETSLELLEERVKALISDIVETPLYEDVPEDGDSKRDIRLLACYLLVCPEGPQALSAYVALMMQLAMVADARFADAIAHLHMEPLYDNQVVAIQVEPHPFRLVELREKSYLRINAESREMAENVRQQIIAQKVYNNRNESAALSMLQHACSTKKTVILHNYASNNSGTISDRMIEPFQIISESGMVYGYNIHDKCNKVYAISRIGYVEIMEQKWEHPDQHNPIHVDDFHMTGSKPIHVNLQLTLAARNLLVEEYPSAKAHITADKNDENIWYYDADVYRMEGVGRFYIGLANMVKIIVGDELKAYTKAFCHQYILD